MDMGYTMKRLFKEHVRRWMQKWGLNNFFFQEYLADVVEGIFCVGNTFATLRHVGY